jgi:PAS domain S-box-containing protein
VWGRVVPVRRVITVYVAWMLLLTALVFSVPSEHVFLWALIGLTSVCAIVYGTVRNRPRTRAPWFLLAAAVLCLVTGDQYDDVLVHYFHQANPFPSAADIFYLTMYVLIAVGMIWLYRLGVVQRDATGILDGLTLTAGLALVSWVYLIGPYVHNPDLRALEKADAIGYPLGDILILAAGASLVASVRATPAVRLLAVGGLGLLASDIAYGLIQLYGTWRTGTAADLGWIVFYGCWGAAALHPSMRELTEPKVLPRREERVGRLVLLGFACLIAPTVLLIEVNTANGVQDGAMIAILSAVLSVLVLVRLGGALRVHRRSAERERSLRQSGTALLLATDVDSVTHVVIDAVSRMLPPATPHRSLLTVPREAVADAASPTAPPAMTMVYTRSLDPSVAASMGDFEITLRCPLAVEGRGRPGPVGALFVAAEEVDLVAVQESVQVLATQAAMAVERITLSAEIDRRNSEAYFRTLVLNTADVILIVDDDDRIRYASPSAATLFVVEDPTRWVLTDLVDEGSAAEVRSRLTRVRSGQPDRGGRDWLVPQPDGQMAQVEASCRDLRADATVGGMAVTLRDVTQSRRMQEELYRQATRDALTGLPNREAFLGAAQRAIGRAVRQDAVAAVIVIELDDFKVVNNTMGHAAGDELLVAVGQRLTDAVRADQSAHSDRPGSARYPALDRSRTVDLLGVGEAEWIVARLGGDEFVACVDLFDQARIDQVIAAIMDCFTEPFVLSSGVATISASVGVAISTESDDAQELLRQADLAVYVAKDAGKGRSLRYEASLHVSVVDRLRLRTDLEKAVSDGDFQLDYQPIVELNTGRTVGFEALVRWPHPIRGLLPPATFIDLAEETGLIVPLGAWVLEHALQAAARWQRLRPDRAPYVTVNVSARQFRAPGFAELVRRQLASTGLPAASLVLEVTESMLVGERGAGEALDTLRADGVKIAIDDFGTGFSSLSYLQQLPVDVLKLDKSFAETVTTSREQQAILTAILQLAQALDLDVVAEGIETDDELNMLVSLGCGFGQGYLMARPLSYGDAVRWLRDMVPTAVRNSRTSA